MVMVRVEIFISGSRKPLSLVELARLVKFLRIENFETVTKFGYGRGKIVFKNAEAANNFIKDERFLSAGFQPKIFAHIVSKMSIVFPVDQDIPMDEIEKYFDSETPILKMFRVMRKEGGDEFPTKKVKILFKGLTLPRTINVYGVATLKVHPHIAFTQCCRCYRFNDFAKHYK